MAEDLNKLIIIGNGFDLYHGLKTSYGHFVNWYLRDIVKVVNDEAKFLKIYQRRSMQNNKATYVLADSIIYNIENILEKKMIEMFVNGLECKYLKSIVVYNEIISKSYDANTKWSNFERIYFNELKKYINEYDSLLGFSQGENINSKILNLNNDLNEIQTEFKMYLKNDTFNNFISTKGEVFKFLKEKPLLGESKINGIVNQNFEEKFDEKICILNFNYTNSLSQYLEDYNIPIIHIHGNVDDKEDLIFGYGDEMDDFVRVIENKYDNNLMTHFKSLKYLQSDRYFKLLNFLEKGKFCVYVIGHSCDITDRVLLNEIFEHPDCQFIKTAYYENDGYSDFNDRVSNIYRCFKDKNLLRKRLLGKPFSTKLS